MKGNSQMLEMAPRRKASDLELVFLALMMKVLAESLDKKSWVPEPLR